MRILVVAVILLLLAACTTTQEIKRPDGSVEYLIACGASLGWNICYDKANQMCSTGYTTLSEDAGFNRKELRIACPSVSIAANNFVPIRLPHGVQIELPRNWEALSENQRITLDSAVQSRNERAGMFDASSDLNFGANYYDEGGKAAAIMNVRYYPDLDVSQAKARASGPSDIHELNSALRESIAKAGQINGFSVLAWNGTVKQLINGATAFVTEYKRSPLNNNGNFKVRLVRIFNGGKSFTLTVSYRENQEYLLRPICDRIISSLRI